jgi:hypothetical protein
MFLLLFLLALFGLQFWLFVLLLSLLLLLVTADFDLPPQLAYLTGDSSVC